jgi:hypothetical protein
LKLEKLELRGFLFCFFGRGFNAGLERGYCGLVEEGLENRGGLGWVVTRGRVDF